MKTSMHWRLRSQRYRLVGVRFVMSGMYHYYPYDRIVPTEKCPSDDRTLKKFCGRTVKVAS